jgi:hypothetical protein
MEPEGSSPYTQEPATCPYPEPDQPSLRFRGFLWYFVTWFIFYGEELLAPRPTPKLEDHPLSAVCDCLFKIFAATLHNWRPFLHPQPEDAPCRGDRDQLIMVRVTTAGRIFIPHFVNISQRFQGQKQGAHRQRGCLINVLVPL